MLVFACYPDPIQCLAATALRSSALLQQYCFDYSKNRVEPVANMPGDVTRQPLRRLPVSALAAALVGQWVITSMPDVSHV